MHQTFRCLKAGPVSPTNHWIFRPSTVPELSKPLNEAFNSESDMACRYGGPEIFSLKNSLFWIKAVPLQASS